ncbi:preprotein translocase subunit SecE [Rubidibacter lacunae]|uniref:preprotein translocase subunit SecE n=1 Tax=Rubidibacter lacunae TaxID=582514 RepID=UPI0005916295|nr:preprotein translocase subunit SecE [Rubidibacter lacunae]
MKNSTAKNGKEVKPKAESAGGFDLVKFSKETQEELAKVVWPSRKQLVSESAAVILMVTLVATLIYFFDNLFAWISGKVF